ncbi:hypothetical protein C900_03153 [Fulvivirga imtechensis AK7]|uniref:TPM domain-containing protein n=1 Tax=Fulvivirga imtechensis AK7 TaxID=1237149 RepID=L8JS24_9BACT|nr:hypothetical protein [Fulvivirga imtechensis]ELR71023.1 hypothetical protein C900_03153 [Fulvivirga imtechensis AK7]
MAQNSFKFTAEEKQQIKKAVEAAESKTSGEIVPFFVDQSDEYEIAALRGAIIFVIAALFIVGLLSYTWALPFPITPLEIIIFTLSMGVLGFVLARYSETVKRIFVPKELMVERVEQKALIAFLEEEVFNTKKRTGILIFVSHFEHMVEVIGDSGINENVKQEEWQAVVKLVIEGIKAKDPASGIIKGIHLCGELLERAGVNKPRDNRNELSDDIRLG